MELKDPRTDGLCIDCEEKPAVTNDGRLCKRCLKKRIYQATPDTFHTSDRLGRKERSTKVTSGCSDMRTTDEMD